MIIALDGPAGSGKSSISKKLAEILNISYLDTGAMYRMVTLYFLQQNLEIEKMSTQKIKSVLENINLDITNNEFYLNGENVTEKIRDNKINNSISKIAANRSVREKLVEIQQKIAKTKSTILDGRDIGTVVFPNAEYKFFLTATPEIRAQRRVKQNKELKIEETYEDILESIKKRDYLDMNREESPLKKAKDAIEIDTSDLTFDEVVAIILQRIKMKLRVGIIGRPNVGKSSLFNRITKTKKSIVEDTPGVTRDRLYEKVDYREHEFLLIDTGGITLENGDFNQEIELQAEIAIDESDVILFVVDGKTGITEDDDFIAQKLRKAKKDIILVVNKVDNQENLNSIYEYYSLGFDKLFPVSAMHGSGIYDILEYIIENYQFENVEEYNGINFSLIGRPNVGKSSLFNAMINKEEVIVSDIEGTTRDAIDTVFKIDDQEYKMIDTAGIRKRGKIYEKIEKYSVLRALKVIEKSDVVLWLIDADQGIVEQDKRVLGYAFEEKKPIIVIVNKWDLIEKETNTQKKFEQNIREKMPFIKNSIILFISAKNKKGINKILPAINEVYRQYNFETTTANVNNILNDAVSRKVHPTYKGQPIRFYYGTQISSSPPKFLIFVNNKKLVHFSYERYLANYFKKSFGLEQVPLEFVFKNRNEENL